MKSVAAFGSVNLQSSEITPATKSDTRKKNAFIITSSDLKIVISVANETLYSDWLDAIMRELISLKENQENQDMDLIQLLASIPLKEKLIKPKPDSTQTAEGEVISFHLVFAQLLTSKQSQSWQDGFLDQVETVSAIDSIYQMNHHL